MGKNKKGKVVSMPVSAEGYFKSGRARKLPIYECTINEGWEETGMASIVVARKHSNGNLSWGVFLVDILCLGVKECLYVFNAPEAEYEGQKEMAQKSLSSEYVDYPVVHNIIYGAAEFAEEFGFSPHKDFKIAQYILEEDDDSVELLDIDFGKNGKPCYIASPDDDPARQNKILSTLARNAGQGNFTFVKKEDEEEYEDEESDDIEDGEWDDDIDPYYFFAEGEIDDILDKGKEPDFIQSFVLTQKIYNLYYKDNESSIGITKPRDLDILALLEDSEYEDEKYSPANEKEEELMGHLINSEGEFPIDQQAENLELAIKQFPHIFDLYGMRLLADDLFKIPLKEDFGKVFFEKFPGTILSKILKASILYSRNDVDGALSLFNNEYKIQHCFPERKGIFTEFEIFHFMALMCRCYVAKGDIATAKVFAHTIIKFGDEDALYASLGISRLNFLMLEKVGEIKQEEINEK